MVKNTTAVDETKAVIASYEKHTKAGDLGGVVSNAAEGVVLLSSEAPLLEGKAALRQFCKRRSWGVSILFLNFLFLKQENFKEAEYLLIKKGLKGYFKKSVF